MAAQENASVFHEPVADIDCPGHNLPWPERDELRDLCFWSIFDQFLALYLTLMREGHMAEMVYICTSKIETAV